MIYVLLALNVVLFLLPILTYRMGLREGMGIAKGIALAPIKNPVQVIAEAKERKASKAKADAFSKGFANLMSYTGDAQREGE